MHDARVILRGADVGRVLEGDPRVARLEEHGQHPPPEVHGGEGAVQGNVARLRHRLVLDISLREGAAIAVVQVGHVARAEEGPCAARRDALHEEIGDPEGGVHVVRAAAVVAGVAAQIEEFLDIEVPRLQIGADRALPLAAIVRESRRGHVRLDALHLQVMHRRARRDRTNLLHARKHMPTIGNPIVLGERHAADNLRDVRHGGDRNDPLARGARELALGALALPVPRGNRHAEAEHLVAHRLHQFARVRADRDLCAPADVPIGLDDAPDDLRRERTGQVCEAGRDALLACCVVQVVAVEGQLQVAVRAPSRPLDLCRGAVVMLRLVEGNAALGEIARARRRAFRHRFRCEA